jgi:hypothetical protein
VARLRGLWCSYGNMEYPDIRYVVYPVHRDGTLTGAEPRLRHYPGCGHFDWGDYTLLGTPVLATDDQMRTLKACKIAFKAAAVRRGIPAGGQRMQGQAGCAPPATRCCR